MGNFYLAEKPHCSIQCEGNTIGRSSIFIRFLGCHFSCSFCDSKHTWKKTEESLKFESSKKLLDSLHDEIMKSQNIIFTGGEPLLHQSAIIDFDGAYKEKYPQLRNTYEIETTLAVDFSQDFLLWCRDNKDKIQFNISPKLQYDYQKVIENLKLFDIFNIPYIIKFVDEYTQNSRDEILTFISTISFLVTLDSNRVFIMSECTTREQQLERFEETIKFCQEYHFTFSPRVHILLWDDKKGV